MKNLYALANLCGKYCGGLETLPITFIIITQVPFTNLDKDSVLLIPFLHVSMHHTEQKFS